MNPCSTTEQECNRDAGINRLETALRAVLGVKFDDEMHALVEDKEWYTPNLQSTEVFRLWVRDNLMNPTDELWIFRPVRTSERKFLVDELGIERASIVGKTPRQLAYAILGQLGLPIMSVFGRTRLIQAWRGIAQLITEGQDEKAAVLCRQRAERLLRTILYFYCSSSHGREFLDILREPGTLRLPKLLADVPGHAEPEQALYDVLRQDGWADLGFLAMAVRKLSSKLEGGVVTSGILTQREFDAFTALAVSLQAYAHDNPSAQEVRRPQLETSVDAMEGIISGLITRNIVPEEMIVLEIASSLLGDVCLGLLDTGRIRKLSMKQQPQLAQRILFVPAANRDYSSCSWTDSPWSPQ